MLRILRLGNSNDAVLAIPEHLRAPSIADAMLAEASGEQVEAVNKTMWPTPDFPEILDRWLDRYAPDVVLMQINAYWYAYPRLLLSMRHLPMLGRFASRAEAKLANSPGIALSRPVVLLRDQLMRVFGGTTAFSPEQVGDVVEASLRVVLARESIGVGVRGPFFALAEEFGGRAGRRAVSTHSQVYLDVERRCARLMVPFEGRNPGIPMGGSGSYLKDRMHLNEGGQALRGQMEGRVLVRAWEQTGLVERPVDSA
ncbi:MAG: hypothetical protein C0506_00720 [Anaerolinea sp.]|nr:hypothetical protein [Anaerolinea sp.]